MSKTKGKFVVIFSKATHKKTTSVHVQALPFASLEATDVVVGPNWEPQVVDLAAPWPPERTELRKSKRQNKMKIYECRFEVENDA